MAEEEEGKRVVFVDDGTGTVSAKTPEALQVKIQTETDSMVDWIRDNKLSVAGEKSKLLV